MEAGHPEEQAARLLPSGTLPIAAGILGSGLGAYGFLIIAARSLGPSAYADLSVLWALSYVVGPGLFLPLEQELSRALSARKVLGIGGASIARRGVLVGAGFAFAIFVLALALRGSIATLLFNGDLWLALALALSLVCFFAHHAVRGLLAGAGAFGRFGAVVAADGWFRLFAAIVLALMSAATGAFALAIAIAPAIAATAAAGKARTGGEGPPPQWQEVAHSLGYLLAASVFSQFLLNAGPITVKLLSTGGENVAAGRFLAGAIVARIPVSVFQAVQAALLPNLSALAASQRFEELRRAVLRLSIWIVGFGVLVSAGAYAFGPEVIDLLFGDGFGIRRNHLLLLAAGSSGFMLSVALVQALVATEGHAKAALGWGVGALVFVVTAVFGEGLIGKVAAAFMAGAIASAAAIGALLFERLRTPR